MKNPKENNNKKEKAEKEEEITSIEKPPEKPPEKPEIKELEEALSDVPPHVKEKITAIFASERISALPHPLISKVTSGHLDKMIDYTDAEDKREHDAIKRTQIFNFIGFILGLGVFIFLIAFLSESEDLLKNILLGLGAFLAGVGTGYGIGTRKK